VDSYGCKLGPTEQQKPAGKANGANQTGESKNAADRALLLVMPCGTAGKDPPAVNVFEDYQATHQGAEDQHESGENPNEWASGYELNLRADPEAKQGQGAPVGEGDQAHHKQEEAREGSINPPPGFGPGWRKGAVADRPSSRPAADEEASGFTGVGPQFKSLLGYAP